MGFSKEDIYRRMSATETLNYERYETMRTEIAKFIEEVEQYKGLVSKVADEFKALKDKLSGAVDEESWAQVSAAVADLDATNAKLEEMVTVKAPDPEPVVAAEEAAPAPAEEVKPTE